MKKITRILLTIMTLALVTLTGTGCTAKAKQAYHMSRANRYYDAGQLSQAEVEYLNVLRYEPANSHAASRLGLIYYDQGRLLRAAYFLAKGSELLPDNLDLRLKLGFIYSSMGQFTQAVAQASFILQKSPRDDQAPLLLMEGSVFPKQVEAARQRLQTLAHDNGDSAAIEVALGSFAMRNHDVATASADYKKAQTLDPKSPAVNAALATVAWANGDLKQADALFKAAADASPTRSPRRMQYARFKIDTGDNAGARAMLAEILKTAPDYLPASLVLAEIAATGKKYDESAGWIEKILALDPDNFDALLFQGRLALVQGDSGGAVAVMKHMASVYAQVPEVHYQLGAAYVEANDLDRAADSFNHALELNPDYLDATLMLAEIQIRNNNPAPAITALERVRQKQPGLVRAQLLLASAYPLQNRINDALAVYQSLETMYPTNDQVILLYGAALRQANEPARARRAFERVLQLVPGHIPATEQLVDLDLAETNFDAAMQIANTQIQNNPKQAAFRILAAKILIAQKKFDQAEAILTQALQLEPDNQGVNLQLAQTYSSTGQNEKALARVNTVIAQDPKNLSALMLAANIDEASKNYQAAADMYEKLIKFDPKLNPPLISTAFNNLACLYSENLNNLDRAYDLAQQARQLLPADPSTADTLGWICFKKGSYETALGLLQESAAKLAAQPEVQFHLGMAGYMMGDEATARPALLAAWQSGASFAGRDDCGRCLAILDVNADTADAAATATLEKRVADQPHDPIALSRLAHIYQRAGNTAKAVAAYEAVLQATTKNLDAMVNLTRFYMATDTPKAYNMAKAASKLAPYDPQVSHTLGRLAFLSGDYQVAVNVLQQTLPTQPNDPALLFDYAQASYAIGRVSDAQAALQNALGRKLPAAQAGPARQMADMMALAAAPAQAAAASARIAEILKAQPDDVPALMAQAAASGYTSDAATAARACEKVLQHYPDFTPAQLQLARLDAADPAQLDRAYDLAIKARNALPDDPEAAKVFGVILVKRTDYSHAVNVLALSAQKLVADPEVFYYLGAAQLQLKNNAAGKASLQRAMALKLSGPLAASAQQMLGQLK